MGPETIIPLLVISVVGGGTLLWHYVFSPQAQRRKRLRRAPRVPIRDVADGQLVRISGVLRQDPGPEGQVAAPLSGRPCALFEVLVEEYRSSGRSGRWHELLRETDFAPAFWLEDHTGRARVELDYPEVLLVQDAKYNSGVLKEPTEPLRALLARHNEAAQGWVFNRRLRYREGVLEAGERVTVLGVACREPDPSPAAAADAGYRERAMRLVLRSPQTSQMLLSDEDGLT